MRGLIHGVTQVLSKGGLICGGAYSRRNTLTFQDDELLYRDYETINLISKIMFRIILRQFKTNRA